MSRLRLAASILACATLLGLAASCSPAPSGHSVLLITLDTTRADAFGQYGNPYVRTPVFDRWARSGTLARWAIADAPLTLPSHATLLTGVPSLGHGVRTNLHARLGDEAETLAEVLRDAGWATAGIVSSRVLARETGIAQGFDHFDDEPSSETVIIDASRYPDEAAWLPARVRRADDAVGLAIAWIRGHRRRPFLLWLHLFDAHSVYDAPAPWPRVQRVPYFAEIAFVESQLRRLQREIEGMERGDELVLAIVADHGEGLDDHREEEHGLFLYDEIVRVPLVFVGPRVPAAHLLDAQVRTMDVASTLLELANQSGGLGLGGSLLPAIFGRGPVPDTRAYSEALRPKLSHAGAAIRSVRTRERKFVWAPTAEVYELATDPGETANVASPGAVEAEREQLEAVMRSVLDAAAFWAEAPQRTDDDLVRLRSLGYLGGASGDAPRPPTLTEELDVSGYDPKDFVDLAMGGRDLEMGYPDRAERKLLRFLATAPDPTMRPEMRPLWSTAHRNLGVLAMRRRDHDTAAREYRAALRFVPGNVAAREGVVQALNLAGRPAEAIVAADDFLETSPNAWRMHLHRALGLLLADRVEEGRAALTRIVEKGPQTDVREVAEYFATELAAGRLEDALEFYRASE